MILIPLWWPLNHISLSFMIIISQANSSCHPAGHLWPSRGPRVDTDWAFLASRQSSALLDGAPFRLDRVCCSFGNCAATRVRGEILGEARAPSFERVHSPRQPCFTLIYILRWNCPGIQYLVVYSLLYIWLWEISHELRCTISSSNKRNELMSCGS